MQAALPMYHAGPAAVQDFWQALCGLVRSHLAQAPDAAARAVADALNPAPALLWPQDLAAHWRDPALLLSQTCGYPLSSQLQGQVQLLGTFAYLAPGAEGTDCRSLLVCRAQDLRGSLADFARSTLAYNASDSQSGYNAPRALLAGWGESITAPLNPVGFFRRTVATGSHVQSLHAVREGRADWCAVDCVTWALWQRDQPALAQQLRVFGRTAPYPGLPLISSLHTPPSVVRALQQALTQISQDADYAALRAPLLIQGFESLPWERYDRCVQMQMFAQQRGWGSALLEAGA